MRVRIVTCRVALMWMVVSVAIVQGARGQAAPPSGWTARDIGTPAIAGSTAVSQGVFTVTAGGTDIWGAADQFHFVYQPVVGDVDVRARVDRVTQASTWSKAGVMIRASLAAGAPHGFALVSSAKGVAFQRRTTAGGDSTNTAGDAVAPPQWVRLVRTGTTLTAYSSADGVSWKTIGSDVVQLGVTAYVGLAVTSHTAASATAATISQVSLTVQQLPSGQSDADIGAPSLKGSVAYSGGAYAITAAGTDVWGTADQFHYVYQPASGDVDVKVRVASVAYADRWSKAGVMIRQSLAADAAHAYALTSAGKGYAFQRRPGAAMASLSTPGSGGAPPGWVRLKRTGNLITAYESLDGAAWTVVGSDSIVLADPVYVGIAVTSHTPAAATTAIVDNFSVVQTQPQTQPPLPPTPGINQLPVVSVSASVTAATAPATLTLTAAASDAENQLTGVRFLASGAWIGTDTTAPYTFNWSAVPAGTYTITAIAYDAQGGSGTSAPITVVVTDPASGGTSGTGSGPVTLTFDETAADAALVSSYVLEIFPQGALTATASPIYQLALGKPAPDAAGVTTIDITTFFDGLPPGAYQATVSARWSGGAVRSDPYSVAR